MSAILDAKVVAVPLTIGVTVALFPFVTIAGSGVAVDYSPTVSVADVTGGGTTHNDARAHDGDLSTYGDIKAPVDAFASVKYETAGDDPAPSGRTEVLLRLNLAAFGMSSAGVPDFARVFFRPASSGSFSLVADYSPADLSTVAAWKEIDVTAFAGAAPSSGFETAVMFANSPAAGPPDPV